MNCRKKVFQWTALVILPFLSFTVWAFDPLGTPDRDAIEYPEDEAPGQAEIELGKMLFFDNRLSINDQQSCASCHNPDLGFSDGMAFSMGTMGKRVGRNAPHLYNLAWNLLHFWDGRAASLEEQALGPIEAAGEMNMPLSTLIPKLKEVPYYDKTFTEVYGSSGVSKENVGKAIAAFERSLISDNSPFDQYLAGNKAAMSPSAIRGLGLFKGKANCAECHDGSNFTDNSFHNIGVKGDDLGRGAIANDKTLNKTFKTPGLRNITLSAPYMHDGSEPSIEAVVRFYNRGGNEKGGVDQLIKPLDLSEQEVNDVVAFLGALLDPVIVERPALP